MVGLFLFFVLIPQYPAFVLGPGLDCNCPQPAPMCPVPQPCPPTCPPLLLQFCPPPVQCPPQLPPPPPPLPPPPPPQCPPQPLCLPCPVQPPCPPSIPPLPLPCPPAQPLPPPCHCLYKRKKRSTILAATTEEDGTTGRDSCNNSAIREIIHKNLGADAKTSKAAIYSQLKAKQKGDYVVLCSQSSSPFISDSTDYCVAGNTDHFCYVFQL